MSSIEQSPIPQPDVKRLEDVFQLISQGKTEVNLLDEYLSLALILAKQTLQDMQVNKVGIARSYEEFMIPIYSAETLEVAVEELTKAHNGSYQEEKAIYCQAVSDMLQIKAQEFGEKKQYLKAIETVTYADNWLEMVGTCLEKSHDS